jgi:tetratricopeptide (TPR) repeat protein
VVHRDLKPGNILVTADGTVKLLDFGIAKLLQPGATESGDAPTLTLMRALTPQFSSPEQILGRAITTASDVYSLGVLLFRLLTDRSPYRTSLATTQDAIREICENEPVKPSAVVATTQRRERIDRELDDIVLKALRKEPEKRYSSVAQLSEDVRRYLAGLPVAARGDHFSYLSAKFIRRYKLQLIAACMVVVALVGGAVAALREAHIAIQERAVAEQQRERAERHFASVRKLADVFLFQMHDAIRDLPGATDARKLLVDTGLEYLNTLSKEASQDRDLQLDLAKAYERLAAIQGAAFEANTGKPEEALHSYAKATALFERLVAAYPTNQSLSKELAENLLAQSRAELVMGKVPTAVSHSERAIGLFEARARSSPDAVMLKALARAQIAHAYTLSMSGRNEEGLGFVERAIATLQRLIPESPQKIELKSLLATAYSYAGMLTKAQTWNEATKRRALDFQRKALELDTEQYAATGGRNAELVRSMYVDRENLSQILYSLGEYAEALRVQQEALKVFAVEGEQNNMNFAFDRAHVQIDVARSLIALGRPNEAPGMLDAAMPQLQSLTEHSNTLQVEYVLALAESTWGSVYSGRALVTTGRTAALRDWTTAEKWYEKALPRFNHVASSVKLDSQDRETIDEATASLERAKAAIARLGGAT